MLETSLPAGRIPSCDDSQPGTMKVIPGHSLVGDRLSHMIGEEKMPSWSLTRVFDGSKDDGGGQAYIVMIEQCILIGRLGSP